MKMLVIGLGGIGQRHLRNLRKLLGDRAEIIAHDPRRDPPVLTDQLKVEEGTTLEQKYNVRIFPDLESALAENPDAAFVCTPTSLHVPSAIQAAQAGCHLFIEKPVSHNLERLDELVGVVENRKLKLAVGYQMRFHPCVRRLHELLAEGKIGRILSVRAEIGEYLPGWHTYEDYRQMYASRKDLGGGVILSQIHEFDYLYWMFGLPGRIFTLGGHLSSLEIDVEDSSDILMDCAQDGQPVPISLHQDYLQRPAARNCTVIGEAGKILVDIAALKVNVYDAEGNYVEASSYEGFPRNQLFLDEAQSFLDLIQGKPSASVSLQDGIQSLRMALAAKESLESGKVVELTRQ